MTPREKHEHYLINIAGLSKSYLDKLSNREVEDLFVKDYVLNFTYDFGLFPDD